MINIDHIIEIKVSGFHKGDDVIVHDGTGPGRTINTLDKYDVLKFKIENAKEMPAQFLKISSIKYRYIPFNFGVVKSMFN